jgi:predicted hotdog family 3-hydroxylacyl-ACP dehydratase
MYEEAPGFRPDPRGVRPHPRLGVVAGGREAVAHVQRLAALTVQVVAAQVEFKSKI